MVNLTDDYDTWVEWTTAHNGVDMPEADRLAALREMIFALASDWTASGEITAQWANKKLAALGVPERLPAQEAPYTLRTPITGTVEVVVYAVSRAEALEKNAQLTAYAKLGGGNHVSDIRAAGDAVFTSGPEDAETTVDDDAPTTVDATLFKLREVIMLGNIAGPRWNCESGTNRVLATFGLAPIPARQTFTVAVPVEGVMKTTVQAYDEDSARRVAGWRWDNGRSGYQLDSVTDTDQLYVAVPEANAAALLEA